MGGPDIQDISEKFYGCNRYKGPSAFHGTHVSGIIAASKNNNLGIEGIADNVKIMVLRAVPNGDEHDKDVALAIFLVPHKEFSLIKLNFKSSCFVIDANNVFSEKKIKEIKKKYKKNYVIGKYN